MVLLILILILYVEPGTTADQRCQQLDLMQIISPSKGFLYPRKYFKNTDTLLLTRTKYYVNI